MHQVVHQETIKINKMTFFYAGLRGVFMKKLTNIQRYDGQGRDWAAQDARGEANGLRPSAQRSPEHCLK